MKKQFLLVLPLLALAVSCTSKDDDQPQPQPPSETWYLASWDEEFQSQEFPIETVANNHISYNADSTISKVYIDTIGPENKSDVAYEEHSLNYKNGKLEQITVKYDNGQVSEKATFTWNQAGQIIGEKGFYNKKFFYNTDGKLIRKEVSYTSAGSEVLVETHEYTWMNGNITRCKLTEREGISYYDITYTNRKRTETGASSMMSVMYGLGLASGEYFELGTHEIASATLTDAAGKVIRSRAYTYTYNEKGQRSKMKIAHLNADGSQNFAYYYTYNYKKH